jgi:hypothetical protein
MTLALQAMYENFKEQNPLLFKPTADKDALSQRQLIFEKV